MVTSAGRAKFFTAMSEKFWAVDVAQRMARGKLARGHFRRTQRAVLTVQCAVRRWTAQCELLRLGAVQYFWASELQRLCRMYLQSGTLASSPPPCRPPNHPTTSSPLPFSPPCRAVSQPRRRQCP